MTTLQLRFILLLITSCCQNQKDRKRTCVMVHLAPTETLPLHHNTSKLFFCRAFSHDSICIDNRNRKDVEFSRTVNVLLCVMVLDSKLSWFIFQNRSQTTDHPSITWVIENCGWNIRVCMEIRSLTFIWLNTYYACVIYRITTLENWVMLFFSHPGEF